ncbi:hypothetical protein Sjap_000419 [Stephania japonica]|uniref:DUF4283 domain-containing protein n=1 Tax=Stephania japonica TaxID=461633 RepID=A0AAP0KK71_9MAGN
MQENAGKEEDSFYENDFEICNDVYVRTIEDEIPKLTFATKRTVMVRVLGKSIGFKVLYYRMFNQWNPTGGFRVMNVDNGYYMVRFSLENDYTKVLLGSPWTIMSHYLTVLPWTPGVQSKSK